MAETCHFIHRSGDPSLLAQSQHALRTPYASADSAEFQRPAGATRAQLPETSETHRVAEIELTDILRNQIRFALTIEPRISETVRPGVGEVRLPQNFQTYITAAQLALEELDGIAATMPPTTSVGDVLDGSTRLPDLPPDQRVRVVAEVLLDPELADRTRGDSRWISEAVDHFPQLNT